MVELKDPREFKKQVEFSFGFPRTRISDCSRLVFSKDFSGFLDITKASRIYPNYKLPELRRKKYDIYIKHDDIYQVKPLYITKTLNGLVYQVCGFFEGNNLDHLFLHHIILRKDGTGWVEYDNL